MDNYSYCDDCGELTHQDDIQHCGDCSHTWCSDCSPCSCNDDSNKIDLYEHGRDLARLGARAIADYHPPVNWAFKSDKLDYRNAPYFGVELEIECQDRNISARKVGELLKGNMIATHDGSLDNGFEIVFTPFKYQAFRKLNFKHILKEISKTGATSHDSGTCGYHIHIEKKAWFNKRIIYKGNYYYNSDLYQRFYNLLAPDIIKLSRRTDDQISNYCAFNTSRGSRYSAVNLCPDETIEVRIWRGTLNPKRFKANLQFTLAVYDFLQQHSKALLFQNPDVLKARFCDWLAINPEYQALVRYCKNKRILGFKNTRRIKTLPLPLRNNSRPIQAIEHGVQLDNVLS
jgi:hypothetical protein